MHSAIMHHIHVRVYTVYHECFHAEFIHCTFFAHFSRVSIVIGLKKNQIGKYVLIRADQNIKNSHQHIWHMKSAEIHMWSQRKKRVYQYFD